MKRTLLLTLFTFAACTASFAQGAATEPTVVPGNMSACEMNSAAFDDIANRLRERSEERLFVIARLGQHESLRELNFRRLHNVRMYFKRSWNLGPDRLLLAEGESVEAEGRVEFYLGSKLTLISLVRRGGDICVNCCEFPDPDYYGFGKRDKPPRRKRR